MGTQHYGSIANPTVQTAETPFTGHRINFLLRLCGSTWFSHWEKTKTPCLLSLYDPFLNFLLTLFSVNSPLWPHLQEALGSTRSLQQHSLHDPLLNFAGSEKWGLPEGLNSLGYWWPVLQFLWQRNCFEIVVHFWSVTRVKWDQSKSCVVSFLVSLFIYFEDSLFCVLCESVISNDVLGRWCQLCQHGSHRCVKELPPLLTPRFGSSILLLLSFP